MTDSDPRGQAGHGLATLTRPEEAAGLPNVGIVLTINGEPRNLVVEPRVTLLDLLREQLQLTGTKKGCNYGQCGACTVHVNGKRVLSCLSLAVMQNGKKVDTI